MSKKKKKNGRFNSLNKMPFPSTLARAQLLEHTDETKPETREQMLRREEARLRREYAEEPAPILSPEVKASFAGMAIGLSMGNKAHLRGLTAGLAGIPTEDEKPADELNAIKELHPPA